MTTLDPHAFKIHKLIVRQGVELAFVREGIGGYPILMLHGWPGGKRLFWRNIASLASAGFEVIVPDQRGFGDSPSVAGSPPSIQESAKDVHALVLALGHDRCVVVGGDMGSGVAIQLSHRFPGFVHRLVIYNGFSPVLPEAYARAGLPMNQLDEVARISDHMAVHGVRADFLAARLDTDAKRLEYVKSFFTEHVWREGEPARALAARGAFDDAAATFLAEPLQSASAFRSSLGFYEGVFRCDQATDPFLIDRPIDVETMFLWGMRDEIIGDYHPKQMKVACRDLVGPFLVDAGHFVQWEAADELNGAVRAFCRDLL